ncbi:MAG: hypothetical protein WDN48_01965 [Pseudolabrys sp.]
MNHFKKSRRVSGLALAILLAAGGALHAQDRQGKNAAYEGSWEERRACRPDVFKLCGSFIPDRDKIVACLERSKPQLSEPCLAVMEGRFRSE